jgi:hypothetical protein
MKGRPRSRPIVSNALDRGNVLGLRRLGCSAQHQLHRLAPIRCRYGADPQTVADVGQLRGRLTVVMLAAWPAGAPQPKHSFAVEDSLPAAVGPNLDGLKGGNPGRFRFKRAQRPLERTNMSGPGDGAKEMPRRLM